jgi:hypothetical protein
MLKGIELRFARSGSKKAFTTAKLLFLAEINALEISSMEHTSFPKAQSLLPSNRRNEKASL